VLRVPTCLLRQLSYELDEDDLRPISPRPSAKRDLILTDSAIVERDAERLVVTSARPLSQLHALLRDPLDEQAREHPATRRHARSERDGTS
jgi:hypothetical protein